MTVVPGIGSTSQGRGNVGGVSNGVGYAVFSPIFAQSGRPPNIARFMFLDEAARDFYLDWGHLANDTVALLRAEAGRDPYEPALTELIGELFTRSDAFGTWWATHNVRQHRSGVKRFHVASRRGAASDARRVLPLL